METASPSAFMHIYDKLPEQSVWTLQGDGSVKEWTGVRFEPAILLLRGDQQQNANWLTEVRNRNLQLCRSTGWELKWEAFGSKSTPGLYYVCVWWVPLASVVYGPFKDLGVAFLSWVASCQTHAPGPRL